MKNVIIILFVFFAAKTALTSQNFMEGYFSFSSKEESFITLQSGEEITGFVDDIDRKKGLIEKIELKTLDGKKMKLYPKDIKSMFLSPSGFEKFSKFAEKVNEADLTEASKDRTMHKAYVKKGYVYFENCTVALKKGTETLLMQLVNPAFAEKTKVFYNPYTKETTSYSVGGFQVAGGIAESYYIQRGDNPAYLISKKTYKKEFPKFFGECKDLVKHYKNTIKWSEFEGHVYYYDNNCN